MNIICVGSVGKDIFLPTKQGTIIETPDDLTSKQKFAFELGAKYYVKNRFTGIGGCAVNVAVGLTRLNISAKLLSVLSNDVDGAWINEELSKEGVDVSLVSIVDGHDSDLSSILVDENTGRRTIFVSRDVGHEFEISSHDLSGADYVYTGSQCGNWRKNLSEIVSFVESKKAKLVYNPGHGNMCEDNEVVMDVVKHTTFLFQNKDEAIELLLKYGVSKSKEEFDDVSVLLHELSGFGPSVVVITDGPKGAWCLSKGEIFHVSGTDKAVVDTTGAGDAFVSGFMAAYLQKLTISESLAWGSLNAENVIESYGAQEGLLRYNEIVTKGRTVDVSTVEG